MNPFLGGLLLGVVGTLSVFLVTGAFWILLGNWQEFWLGIPITLLFGGALWLLLLTRKVVR